MNVGFRRVALPALILVGLAGSFGARADVTAQSEIAEIQLQLANELFVEGRYAEALDAYQKALAASAPADTSMRDQNVLRMLPYTNLPEGLCRSPR